MQRELELAADAQNLAIVFCDRGTVDGTAYWPGPDDFWAALGTTLDEQLRRYDAVIHLRTPALGQGYNHHNPLRLESVAQAAEIDGRLASVWTRHPRRFEVASTADFLDKAGRVLEILRDEVPGCCRQHDGQKPDPQRPGPAPEAVTARR